MMLESMLGSSEMTTPGIILITDNLDKRLALIELDLISVAVIIAGYVKVAFPHIPCTVRCCNRSLDRIVRTPVLDRKSVV